MPGERIQVYTIPTERGQRILDVAADAFYVRPADLLGRDKHQTIALARHVAMYLLRLEQLSYPEIGRMMNRDHTSVMSGVKRIVFIVHHGRPAWIGERVHRAEQMLTRYRIAT